MKHVAMMSKHMPLAADACCDCQERKVGKTDDVWAKCEKLGVCEGPSYVCID